MSINNVRKAGGLVLSRTTSFASYGVLLLTLLNYVINNTGINGMTVF
jgi:hypothetical protein